MLATPSRRMSGARVSPWTTRVTITTSSATSTTCWRAGNPPPPRTATGRASAVATVTTPRIPAHEATADSRHPYGVPESVCRARRPATADATNMAAARDTTRTPITAPAIRSVGPCPSTEACRSTRMSTTPRKANSRPLTANSTYCHTDRPSSQPAEVSSLLPVERSSSPATRTASTPEAPSRSASRYSPNGTAIVTVVSVAASRINRNAHRASQPPARPSPMPPATAISSSSPTWPAVTPPATTAVTDSW